MYIQEAVKRAVEEDRCITTADFLGDAKIKPTDEKGNCIVMEADGSNPHNWWNPSASDLMRDDWYVVD